MTENDKRKFAALMTQASEIYKRDVSQTLMKTYFDLLSDYEIADVETAFFNHFGDEKAGVYFPMPANLIGQLKSMGAETSKSEMVKCLVSFGDEEAQEVLVPKCSVENCESAATMRASINSRWFCRNHYESSKTMLVIGANRESQICRDLF
ncbi:MAG: hypothetical protein CMF49_06190 [Legionellales bacterium]|nr:hypothetical protein [Legionellales bacterium]